MLPLVLLAAVSFPIHTEEWTVFAPKGTGLSISFPGKPAVERHQNAQDDFDAGTAKVIKGVCVYEAVHGVLPREGLRLFSKRTLTDMFLKPILIRGGRIIEDNDLSKDGQAIRQVLIQAQPIDKTLWRKAHLCIVGNKMLVAEVTSEVRADLDTEEAKRFFQSFKVVAEK